MPYQQPSDDPRLGSLISGDSGDVVIAGYPFDEGVRRNGGRPGAREGPAAFREFVSRTGPLINAELGIDISHLRYFADLTLFRVGDSGDIDAGLEFDEAETQQCEKIARLIGEGRIPFSIGGGNDQSWPNANGLLSAVKARGGQTERVGVVNIDAHFDVRPLKEGQRHSGSPFRMLLEDPRFQGSNFAEFAAQGNQCSATHADYILQKGGRIFWLNQITANPTPIGAQFRQLLDSLGEHIFVSFDLGSEAPGVSAPGTRGLSVEAALSICFEAGACPAVALFDLSEFNPQVDKTSPLTTKIERYRTGKLVACMFYYFLLGYAKRPITKQD